MERFTISDIQYINGKDNNPKIYAVKVHIICNPKDGEVAVNDILEPITFNARHSEVIKIQVYKKRQFCANKFKGTTLEKSISDLCDIEGPVILDLYKGNNKRNAGRPTRSIQFKIRDVSRVKVSAPTLDQHVPSPDINDELKREEVPRTTDFVSLDVHDAVDRARIASMTFEDIPWQPLLTKIKLFSDMMSVVAEVHPYAKLTWHILFAASNAMVDQLNRDENIRKLVSLLDDIFDFLNHASQVEDIAKLAGNKERQSSEGELRLQIQILVQISQQVTECGHFICGYAKDTKFWKRTIKHFVSEIDDKIQEFQDIFSRLKSSFLAHATLETELSVLQIKFTARFINDKLDDIAMNIAVDKMLHATGARYNPDKGCLPNTRVVIVNEIMEWVSQLSVNTAGANILWLSGVAGSGKSAIAHTVAQRFQTLGRLGSSFCFNASRQAECGPQHLFTTISWELANFDDAWKLELSKVLKANPSITSSHSILEQFEVLLLKPALALHITGPIVIVIDALDECGDASSRRAILSVLASKIKELPSNFCFFLTSRPEPDILKTLQPCSHILSKHMVDIDAESTKEDIFQFIQSSISTENKASLNQKWNGESWCHLLVEKAERLFQWAFTACSFIEEDFSIATKQLEILLQPTQKDHNLDLLYTQILNHKTSGGDPAKVDSFVSVMRTVLALKKPLPMSALAKLHIQKDLSIVTSSLRPLGALLSGIASESTPVQALHTSLHDFLTDENRSGCYFIDITKEHENLASGCLEVMDELCFNICQLPTSSKRNQEFHDLESRIEKNISSSLLYASRFWADHLGSVGFQDAIGSQVSGFMKTKFLYWLEVLSLTETMEIALGSLRTVIFWIGDNPTFEQVVSLSRDAISFIVTYWSVITESAPHIYLSALPSAPEMSLVVKEYSRYFNNVLSIKQGKKSQWPGGKMVLAGHQEQITCISVSPDGQYIASGSTDQSIWIWNAKTGKIANGPMFGHTKAVTCILFTPDNKYVLSGSADTTIQLWDAQTGFSKVKLFEGHTGGVTSMACSQDGQNIVSGSDDGTIRIWDMNAKGNSRILGRKSVEPVKSVACSPNGRHVASCTGGIKIWDLKTGLQVMEFPSGNNTSVYSFAFSPDGSHLAYGTNNAILGMVSIKSGYMVHQPMAGHTGPVHTVAFSHDGRYVTSGSADKTVRILDAHTGQFVGDPLEGHSGTVTSVLFSPDKQSIISGSLDKTIRVWDLESATRTMKDSVTSGAQSEGHSHVVRSVAISLDCKYIVSGSYDQTIKLWDLKTGNTVGSLFQRHSTHIRSIAFSPNGMYIASGSIDGTIRIWSSSTGLPINQGYEGHDNWAHSVSFSPEGTHLVSGSEDGTVIIWDVQTGDMVVGPIEGHTGGVKCVMFSPDGKFIVSGDEMYIHLWDADTGNALGKLVGHTSNVWGIAISHDGQYIASASSDHTVRLWNVETNEQIGTPLTGHQNIVLSVVFTPDGKYLVSGSIDTTLIIWDIQAHKVAGQPLYGHTGGVTSVAISSDGSYFVSGSYDQTIRVWDFQLVLLAMHNEPHVPKSGLFDPYFKSIDGWVEGRNGLLFWLPTWNRHIKFSPQNPIVITRKPTVLNYDTFVYGEDWEGCKAAGF